jgi:hypothetical protein
MQDGAILWGRTSKTSLAVTQKYLFFPRVLGIDPSLAMSVLSDSYIRSSFTGLFVHRNYILQPHRYTAKQPRLILPGSKYAIIHDWSTTALKK